jgi:hypothetical protein
MALIPLIVHLVKPHATAYSTERYTVSQVVWNIKGEFQSREPPGPTSQEPSVGLVTWLLPSLQGTSSTITPHVGQSTRLIA